MFLFIYFEFFIKHKQDCTQLQSQNFLHGTYDNLSAELKLIK